MKAAIQSDAAIISANPNYRDSYLDLLESWIYIKLMTVRDVCAAWSARSFLAKT